MKPSHVLIQILLINSLVYQVSHAKFSFDTIKSYLFSKPTQETVQQEFALSKNGTIKLQNPRGNVTIKGWKQNTVHIKATKIARKKEQLDHIVVNCSCTNNRISIAAKFKQESKDGRVDYELLVPETTKLFVKNDQGSVTVKKINAPIKVVTQKGDIIIFEAQKTVVASTNRGTININKSSGSVQANAVRGNIQINGSTHNVVAKTERGTILATCQNLPSLDTISLTTQSGNIALELPVKIDADLQARTARGKLTCEHYITVKPQAIQLNKQTWARLKKEVNGTLGSGEATIRLSAGSGNIKITKTT